MQCNESRGLGGSSFSRVHPLTPNQIDQLLQLFEDVAHLGPAGVGTHSIAMLPTLVETSSGVVDLDSAS